MAKIRFALVERPMVFIYGVARHSGDGNADMEGALLPGWKSGHAACLRGGGMGPNLS